MQKHAKVTKGHDIRLQKDWRVEGAIYGGHKQYKQALIRIMSALWNVCDGHLGWINSSAPNQALAW